MGRLITFGCSWTYGDELGDPSDDTYRLEHVWGGLVAKHYKLEFVNHGYPGASLTSIRDAVTWYVANDLRDDDILMIGLTSPERQSWYNNAHRKNDIDPPWMNHVHLNWMTDNESAYSKLWQQQLKSFLMDQQCEEWKILNYNQTVTLIDGICARFDIPVIQFNMLDEMLDCYHPKTLFMPEYNMGEYLDEFVARGEKIWQPGGHPNEKGHQIIAEKLISYIDSVKILE